MTLAVLLKKLREDRGFTQEQLALVVDLSRNTIAKIEMGHRAGMHAGNARNLLMALAAESPLDESECAWFLELSGLSTRSTAGELDDADRLRMREQGVILDPDRDPGARSMLPAFSIYGERIARIRGIGVSDVFHHRRKAKREEQWRSLAHELVDEICDYGGHAPGYLAGELGRMSRELAEGAAARAAPNEALEQGAEDPKAPPPIVPEGHTAYPAEGRVVTTYSPDLPPPTATPPAAATPPAPAKPKARRKSG